MEKLKQYLVNKREEYMTSAKECKKSMDYLGLVAMGAKATALNDVLKFLDRDMEK